MNRNAGFTLYGVYDYFEEKEEPLFENIRIYNGGTYAPGTEYEQIIPAIDKNVLTDEIIERWGDFLCWRQIPDLFKFNVIRFFDKHYDNFERMWTALHMEYNPLYNFDKYADNRQDYNSYMEETDRKTYIEETNVKPTGKETVDTTHITKEEVETKRAADNVDQYSPYTKTETKLAPDKVETTFDQRNTETKFERKAPGGTIKNDHKGNDDYTGHERGNYGAATSAQMLDQELNIRQYDFYKMVADKFAHELLLMIY